MMKFWKNLFILLGILGFFSLVSAVPTSAQTAYHKKHRNTLSEINFLKDFGGTEGQKYISALEGDKEDRVMCGNENNMCKRATQVCLKCEVNNDNHSVRGETIGRTHATYGFCAPLEAAKSSNLWAYWKGTTDCRKNRDIDLGINPGILTIAENGFVDERQSDYVYSKLKKVHTFPGADNKKYRLIKTGDKLSVAYGNSDGKNNGGAFIGCEVFPSELP